MGLTAIRDLVFLEKHRLPARGRDFDHAGSVHEHGDFVYAARRRFEFIVEVAYDRLHLGYVYFLAGERQVIPGNAVRYR